MSNKTLLTKLDNKYNLCFSKEIERCLSNIKLTYNYLIDYVEFCKNFDPHFVLTAIPLDHPFQYAKQDIDVCLSKKNIPQTQMNKFIIHYVEYEFENADNRFGVNVKSYKHVYLMFFDQEKNIIKYFNKFHHLKIFI